MNTPADRSRKRFPVRSDMASAYYHQDVYLAYGSPDRVPAAFAAADPASVPELRRDLVRLLALNLSNDARALPHPR